MDGSRRRYEGDQSMADQARAAVQAVAVAATAALQVVVVVVAEAVARAAQHLWCRFRSPGSSYRLHRHDRSGRLGHERRRCEYGYERGHFWRCHTILKRRHRTCGVGGGQKSRGGSGGILLVRRQRVLAEVQAGLRALVVVMVPATPNWSVGSSGAAAGAGVPRTLTVEPAQVALQPARNTTRS